MDTSVVWLTARGHCRCMLYIKNGTKDDMPSWFYHAQGYSKRRLHLGSVQRLRIHTHGHCPGARSLKTPIREHLTPMAQPKPVNVSMHAPSSSSHASIYPTASVSHVHPRRPFP